MLQAIVAQTHAFMLAVRPFRCNIYKRHRLLESAGSFAKIDALVYVIVSGCDVNTLIYDCSICLNRTQLPPASQHLANLLEHSVADLLWGGPALVVV